MKTFDDVIRVERKTTSIIALPTRRNDLILSNRFIDSRFMARLTIVKG